MTYSSWNLRTVNLSNFLGFFGSKEISFSNGLQFIHADNHAGKTSLAIGILWGITGELPSIGRITGNQFQLKHKLAAETDLASSFLFLNDKHGNTLSIKRTTKSGGKTAKLVVQLNADVFEGTQAQEVIYNQIGLKHNSLEGCCVILQEQRFNFMTGDMKKNSDVIHDILGLSMLSKMMPILNDKIKRLKDLIKVYEGNDPRKKWEEHHQVLSRNLKDKEIEAANHGCDPRNFSLSEFLQKEFHAIYQSLEISPTFGSMEAKATVLSLREAIKSKRMRNPLKIKQDEFNSKVNQIKGNQERIQRSKQSITEVVNAYSASVGQYKVGISELVAKLIDVAETHAIKHQTFLLLKEQHGLYAHSLSLLQQQNSLCKCPLCNQAIDRQALIHDIHAKMDQSIKATLEIQENEVKQLSLEKTTLEELQRKYNSFERTMQQHLHDVLETVRQLNSKYEEQISSLLDNPLIKLAPIIDFLDVLEKDIHRCLENALQELAQVNTSSQKYEERLNPLEQRLDKIALYLIPIHEIHCKLLEHEARKNIREEQSNAYIALLEATKSYHIQLTEFKNFLQMNEKEKANQTVAQHEGFVSQFFINVANNPNYDRIAITADTDRGSVKYDFEASSTRSPHFTDAAKHVLSGGDLSCACLGLMLSLMKGRSNKTNFLVLDDPGESLDTIRMENLAANLQSIPDQQTIILTHQQDLAAKLRQAGAASINL